MVSERGQNQGRMLRDRQDAIPLRRHGDAVAAVQVEDALRISRAAWIALWIVNPAG